MAPLDERVLVEASLGPTYALAVSLGVCAGVFAVYIYAEVMGMRGGVRWQKRRVLKRTCP